MRRLLVTGGAGFIGCNLIQDVLQHEPDVEVVNLDALTYAGALENLEHLPDARRYHFVHGDICDRPLVEDVLRRHQIDTIVHLAAESHVDRSIYGPAAFVRTNIQGTFTLLEAARTVWLEEGRTPTEVVRFHHVSTDEVYGSLAPDEPAFHEATPYRPSSPYAASKAASDHLVRAFGQTYGLPVTLSNCSNNYGPHQFPEKLIPLLLLNAIEGKPFPMYGDGRQIRDWVYVTDHCLALRKILDSGRPGETYHVGGSNQPTNLELALQLCQLLDERLPESPYCPHAGLLRHVPDRPGHDRRYAMDCSKIERELDWRPLETLQSGLRKTVDWYLGNPEWVATIRGRPAYQEWIARNYVARGEPR